VCCGNKYNTTLPWEDGQKGNCREPAAWQACTEDVARQCATTPPPAPEPAPVAEPNQPATPPDARPAPQPNPAPGSQPNPNPNTPPPAEPAVNVPVPPVKESNSRFESVRRVLAEYKPVEGKPVGTLKMDVGKWGSSWAAGNVIMAFCGMNTDREHCFEGTPEQRRGIGGARVIPPQGKYEFNDNLGNVRPEEVIAKYKDYPGYAFVNAKTIGGGWCELATTVRVAGHRAGMAERPFNKPSQVQSVISYGTGAGYDGDIKHWQHSPYIDGRKMDFNNVAVNDSIDPKMFVSIVEKKDAPRDNLNDGDLVLTNTSQYDLIIITDFEEGNENIIVSQVFFATKVQNVAYEQEVKEPQQSKLITTAKAADAKIVNVQSGQKIQAGKYALANGVIVNIDQTKTVNFYNDINGNGIKDANESIVAGHSFKLEKYEESFQYQILNGWNAFNFPFFKSDKAKYKASDLIAVLNGQNAQVTTIKRWNGKWEEYINENGRIYGNDFEIMPNEGYFVKSTNSKNVSFYGYVSDVPMPLTTKSGWSLVGVAPGYASQKVRNFTHPEFKDGISAFELLKTINSSDPGVNATNLTRLDSGVYRNVNYVKSNDQKYKEFGLDFKLNDLSAYFIRSDKRIVFTP
jgi:hypothetical protein